MKTTPMIPCRYFSQREYIKNSSMASRFAGKKNKRNQNESLGATLEFEYIGNGLLLFLCVISGNYL